MEAFGYPAALRESWPRGDQLEPRCETSFQPRNCNAVTRLLLVLCQRDLALTNLLTKQTRGVGEDSKKQCIRTLNLQPRLE